MPDFSTQRSSLAARLQAAPYTAASMGVLLVAAYLCLVNLDYAALWHDEAPAAFFGKTLLQQGSITGWDGRNLVGGTNGRMLNEDLREVWPPLMYVLNAAGFMVFDINEIGARVVHAVIGVVALGVFYLLLGQHLPNPRLTFFIFVFAAGSAQLLLYFRQSRYFSVMVLSLILLFYLYERYWRSRNSAYLPVIALVAALSFFNHYAGGAATMLSLAAYHLLFRARATTRREWVLFAICGVAVAAVGSSYLYWLGVIGGERSGFMGFAGQNPTPYQGDKSELVIFIERIWIYTRELFTADWISWPVFLWFVGVILLTWQVRRKQAVGASRQVRRRAQRAQRWRIHCPKDTRRRLPTGGGRKNHPNGCAVCAVFGDAVGAAYMATLGCRSALLRGGVAVAVGNEGAIRGMGVASARHRWRGCTRRAAVHQRGRGSLQHCDAP